MRKTTLAESQQAQKDFLVQLFPVVSVTTSEFTGWLDEFEVKVRDILEGKDEEVQECSHPVFCLRCCIVVVGSFNFWSRYWREHLPLPPFEI